MIWDVKLKGVYNFNLYAPAVLGLGYRGAAVLTTQMDYSMALAHNQNLVAIHKQVFSYLPSGTLSNARDLTYLLLRASSGEVITLAHEWIKTQPVLVNKRTARILVDDVIPEDMQRLQDLLVRAGYSKLAMGFLDND